jgi:hypothetical protein
MVLGALTRDAPSEHDRAELYPCGRRAEFDRRAEEPGEQRRVTRRQTGKEHTVRRPARAAQLPHDVDLDGYAAVRDLVGAFNVGRDNGVAERRDTAADVERDRGAGVGDLQPGDERLQSVAHRGGVDSHQPGQPDCRCALPSADTQSEVVATGRPHACTCEPPQPRKGDGSLRIGEQVCGKAGVAQRPSGFDAQVRQHVLDGAKIPNPHCRGARYPTGTLHLRSRIPKGPIPTWNPSPQHSIAFSPVALSGQIFDRQANDIGISIP